MGILSNGINPEDYFDMSTLPAGGYFDAWGIYHKPWPQDPTFEEYFGPFSKKEKAAGLKEFPSPKVDEESLIKAKKDLEIINNNKKASTCYSGSVYEWSTYIRGLEEFMIDTYSDPENVHTLVNKVGDFVLELSTKIQNLGVDILAFYDDFGQQDRLQISPESWRKFIKPVWKRIWSEIRSRNKDTIIFLHSCGCIEEVIPDLIEIGLDVLHPLQPETMDIYEISKQFKNQIAFWGTVSSQHTIPFGTPKEIEAEIKERVERIGKYGGFTVSPANIMGPEVPLDNITAFAESCEKYCSKL